MAELPGLIICCTYPCMDLQPYIISSCAVLDSFSSLMELLPGDQITVQSMVRFVDKRDNDVTYSPACMIACANLKPEMQCTNKQTNNKVTDAVQVCKKQVLKTIMHVSFNWVSSDEPKLIKLKRFGHFWKAHFVIACDLLISEGET